MIRGMVGGKRVFGRDVDAKAVVSGHVDSMGEVRGEVLHNLAEAVDEVAACILKSLRRVVDDAGKPSSRSDDALGDAVRDADKRVVGVLNCLSGTFADVRFKGVVVGSREQSTHFENVIGTGRSKD